MKNKRKILFILIVSTFLMGIFVFVKSRLSSNVEYLENIKVNDMLEIEELKEEIIIYIGRPDCSDCITFEPMFEKVVKENNYENKIKYLNVKDFRQKNTDEWNAFKEKYDFSQTPALLKFQSGKVVSVIEWDTEKGLSRSLLENWLSENI